MWVLDIAGETKSEMIDVLERLEEAGIRWCNGYKPTESIPTYNDTLTLEHDLKLYHGGGGEVFMTAKEFLEKPINYVYTFRDYDCENKPLF